MKKHFRFFTQIAIVALLVTTSQSEAFGDTWAPTYKNVLPGTMMASLGGGLDNITVSRRTGRIPNPDGSSEFFVCPDGVSPSGPCSAAKGGALFFSNYVLPNCESATQTDCLENFSYGTTASELKGATFVKSLAGQKYPSVESYGGLPAASTASIWDAPGLPNSAGNTKYAVAVTQAAIFDKEKAKYSSFQLSAAIYPISERTGPEYKTPYLEDRKINGHTTVFGWQFTPGCVATEDNYCAVIENFAPDSRFSITIRASNALTGWFKGRIERPNVSIEKFSATNNRITMTAEPVQVPRLGATVTAENTTDKGKALLKRGNLSGDPQMFKGQTLRNIAPDDSSALEWVSEFRKAAKDTAIATTGHWSFSTLGLAKNTNKCFTNTAQVIGVVTTNATALASGTPEFSKGTLDYKVAGLHYAPDGTSLNLGMYDLILRSDVARCLYGFTKAPISAKIAVINDSGEKKVATTLVSEKNGWIKMAAYGFTFSSPTIRVQITQKKRK